jgi:exoribonuclease-2
MNQLKSIARRVMTERGLLPDFSAAGVAEVSALREGPPASGPAIRDLRDLLWASIDNDTSRDLDQLSVAEKMADGAVKVLVAIADVDAVVKRHSAIDEHAQTNTTSVYTAAAIFPMLPERLSTDLTSLGEDRERLAIVIEMVVAPDGTLKTSEIYRAAVRNHAKLAYNALAAWLDGYRARRQRSKGGAASGQICGSVAIGTPGGRTVRWPRDRRVGEGNLGAHPSPRNGRQSSERISESQCR